MILGSRGRLNQNALAQSLYPPQGPFKSTDLIKLPGVTRPLIQISSLTNAREFTYRQALCALIAADILTACEMPDEQLKSALKNLLAWADETNGFMSCEGEIAVFKYPLGSTLLWLDHMAAIRPSLGNSIPYVLPLGEIPERFNRLLHGLHNG